MSYEFIIPIVFLIILACLIVFSMLWVVRQAELDVKKIKELS